MSTASAASVRIGRTYTRARRHPWVMGKIGDWTLPLGPYTPAQLIIAAGGIFLLIKTFSWWAPSLGPVPVVVLGVAVWAARASRIGGRSPLWVAYGWTQYVLQPASGRIGGRTVREGRTTVLHGSFLIEETTAPPAAGAAPSGRGSVMPRTRPTRRAPAASSAGKAAARRRGRRRSGTARTAPAARPVPTPLQQLLRERQGVRR
ncbi:hypothetical protein [Streptomyces sp. TRM68367]|uniref:hypothetical protein n=1 Tax=Streptomyces sp. TRM68367 TaxID=2758415 RepID=UPI00165CA721|nr:hypothetical protein [Streptomyces sp. TRM68367]MBC9729308.1 hypothetical protein [Streptomyces sp. TRM68367]